jgi:hypothetical protein
MADLSHSYGATWLDGLIKILDACIFQAYSKGLLRREVWLQKDSF